MASEELHVAREHLSRKTLEMHYAITSLMEELEAIDWYRQRADDIADPELRAIVLHNAKEEWEHAAMILEWIRRHDPQADDQLREYLGAKGSVAGHEAQSGDEHGL